MSLFDIGTVLSIKATGINIEPVFIKGVVSNVENDTMIIKAHFFNHSYQFYCNINESNSVHSVIVKGNNIIPMIGVANIIDLENDKKRLNIRMKNGLRFNCGIISSELEIDEPKEEVINIENVLLDKNNVTLNITGEESSPIYESSILTASITPANVNDKSVSWISSNPEVVTVQSTSELFTTITATGEGNTIITVTTNNGLTATCNVTVINNTVSAIASPSVLRTQIVAEEPKEETMEKEGIEVIKEDKKTKKKTKIKEISENKESQESKEIE